MEDLENLPGEFDFPEPVEGAICYRWDSTNKVWIPVFEEQQNAS